MIFDLIKLAKQAIEKGEDVRPVIAALEKLAYDDGVEGQDEQDKQRDGKVYQKMLGKDQPEDEEDGRKEASLDVEANSNKKCRFCGQDTDSHAPGCASNQNVGNAANKYTKKGKPRTNAPSTTMPASPSALNPMKSHASDETLNLILAAGYVPNRFVKQASHVEDVEIPMKDIDMDTSKEYNLLGNQTLNRVLNAYLRTFVYATIPNFTVMKVTREGDSLHAHCLVFDNQLAHTSAQNDTNTESLNKISSMDGNILVSCPIEDDNTLTRSCGSCPLAENKHTYAIDGGVKCHFDDAQEWLNSIQH